MNPHDEILETERMANLGMDSFAKKNNEKKMRYSSDNGSHSKASPLVKVSNALKNSININMARKFENKHFGMAEVAARSGVKDTVVGIETHERRVRKENETCWLTRFSTTLFSAILVFLVYLVTLETVMSCALCLGLTMYWYYDESRDWHGGGMDWIVLGFAVVTPLTVTITLAFRRRELALEHISKIKSFCFQIYLGHCIWGWKGKDQQLTPEQLLEHTDILLEHLVGIGDELSRFLTLPTSSRSYHRMMHSGRVKAAGIMEVAYRLLDSLYTQRILKISQLTEFLKDQGLSATEASRLRQYERFVGESIEMLRMIKMYRTPQALRSFGRLFTLFIPAFYSPAFAQLAKELDSLPMGIAFSIITPLILTALFQTMQVMEDPFVGFLALDRIDVNEEMEVLHFQQMISARRTLFPFAQKYEHASKAAIVSEGQVETLGDTIQKSRFNPGGTQANIAKVADDDSLSDESEKSRRSHFKLDRKMTVPEQGKSRKSTSARDLTRSINSHSRNATTFY